MMSKVVYKHKKNIKLISAVLSFLRGLLFLTRTVYYQIYCCLLCIVSFCTSKSYMNAWLDLISGLPRLNQVVKLHVYI